jgi:hypothetical protein
MTMIMTIPAKMETTMTTIRPRGLRRSWNHPADIHHFVVGPVSGELSRPKPYRASIVTKGGVEQVLVNGEDVSVNGGSFTKEVRFDGPDALPIYVARSRGRRLRRRQSGGLRGQKASAEEPVADALVVGLGNDF